MTRALDLSTYLITDRRLCEPHGVEAVVRAAVAGGVSVVQLRDPDAKTASLVEQARSLLRFLRPAGIPLIVNDRVDVALAAGADGVHVGQLDMRVEDVRALIGPERIVGLSITSRAQLEAAQAQALAVNYFGVGPVFATTTKPDASTPIGLAGLAEIVGRSGLPVAAIGGIGSSNAGQVIRAGVAGVAVVSAICGATDPEMAARELVEIVRDAKADLRPR